MPATPRAPATADAFRPHDHRACRRAALAAVRADCAGRGLRLTPARALVLESLLESHRAMTAYELLDRLRAAGLGSQPPVVYRALDFLVGNGFAHRVERLSAFVACTHGGSAHAAGFLICRRCRGVAEADLTGAEAGLAAGLATGLAAGLTAGLAAGAAAAGFLPERVTIEAEGLCARCREPGE